MARKVIQIHNAEAVMLQALIAERDIAAKSVGVALNAMLARHEVGDGVFVGLEGNEVYIDFPDDAAGKLNRTGAPAPLELLSGGAGHGPKHETPPESTPDGKKGHSGAPSEPAEPEIRPVDELDGETRRGIPSGVGDFQHTERSQ